MAEISVNIFVGNTTFIDPEVYKLWLEGHSSFEGASIRYQKLSSQTAGLKFDLLKSDTTDNYRMFLAMEKHLRSPVTLSYQPLFQIPPDMQRMLIEKYYELDSIVAREILGKKLSSKHRKDLDEVSDKTKVSLKSCRRQYDNFKRVFKAVEDMEGPMVKNIQANFCFSELLAKKYAAVVFFANNRFETGKKRLQYLTFSDFAFCADEMIVKWTAGSTDSRKEDLDADFDREFLQELRELKILVSDKDASDQHKGLISASLKGKISEKAYADIESNFKNLSRAIVNIASGMIHSKELRDFFNDVVEKIVEPTKQAQWTSNDMALFLKCYTSSSYQIEGMGRHSRLHTTLERYMTTLTKCVLRMYHS
ncbi:acidic fibroblast growth factor intracellular-binding protein-like [Patiria miniata]|uniref:Acidic fibroblast growth factor intracellular-binding protein n=1 Tax=Patiria miniata TaxID=46514 RepID=A0A914BIZ0_PATMI|nr:acidic fibroblast growth factor intracellular-binding protein-like [Patiria miniata]